MKRVFLAGSGRADITPAPGGHIYGYSADEYSVGIHDPLDAKALALSDGISPPLILVSASVCEIGTPYAREIREPVAAACGTTPERVLLSAIHTHAAPNVAGLGNLWGSRDKPYFFDIFVPGIVTAAKQAVQSLAPAEYAVVKGQTEIGVNRRERKLDGTVKLGQNPWGPQDKDLFVLRFRSSETKAGIFQMVYYGCHGTAAGHAQLISRDWAGVMLDALEEKTGTTSALWCGSIGDVGPRIPNGKTIGDIQIMEDLGAFAAGEALRIAAPLDSAAYTSDAFTHTVLPLTFAVKPMPPKEEAEAFLKDHPADGEYTKTVGLKVAYMARCLERYEKGETLPETKTVEGAIVTLGEAAAFCFAPFELFSETTLMLRRFSPYPNTLGVSVTNGFEKYLPSQTEILRGGYEVNNFRYADVPIQEDADFVLLRKFLDALDKLHTAE